MIDSIIPILDIGFTSICIYLLYYFFKESYTASIVQGLLTAILLYVFTRILRLETVRWMFERFFSDLPIFIIVLFHQEIRRFLSNLGRRYHKDSSAKDIAHKLSQTLQILSKNKVGALIIVEGTMKLDEFIHTGVELHAKYSDALIQSIFHHGTALHDGAVIIRHKKIHAAHVFLPTVVTNQNATGTRHLAAISISAERDCVSLIVSEETGKISYAKAGVLTPIPYSLTEEILREILA